MLCSLHWKVAELLNPQTQHVKCCACSLLRCGLQMYLRVLNMRSSLTDPGTITITSSASFTHSPNQSRAPKRLMGRNVLLLALESGWAECCSELGTSYFRPPPHHSASPCAGAVPQGLDAQATELGTCLWAHGPLSTSHHFPPGNSGLFWWGFFARFNSN
jgi:hypothetical protein